MGRYEEEILVKVPPCRRKRNGGVVEMPLPIVALPSLTPKRARPLNQDADWKFFCEDEAARLKTRAEDIVVFQAHVREAQNTGVGAEDGGRKTLVIRRIDPGADEGWPCWLTFRIQTQPRLLIDGRSPKLGVYNGTNAFSRDVLTACYLKSGHVLSGGPNGCITVWDGIKAEWQRPQKKWNDDVGHVPDHVYGSAGGHRGYRAMDEQFAHRKAKRALRGESVTFPMTWACFVKLFASAQV